MALLTIDAADVAPVEVWEQFTRPVGEALDAGEYGRMDTSTGSQILGNATTSGEVGISAGIALNTVGINRTTTFVRHGILNVGDALSGMAYGAPVYLSDTDGTLADAAGTVTTAIVGYVFPGFGSPTPDKLLYVRITN